MLVLVFPVYDHGFTNGAYSASDCQLCGQQNQPTQFYPEIAHVKLEGIRITKAADFLSPSFIKLMSRIIVTTSGKGRRVKPPLRQIWHGLSPLGAEVVLVDGFGLRNLDLLLGLENRVIYTAVEVFTGECRLEQALVKDKREPNWYLPAAQKSHQGVSEPRTNATAG